MKNLKEYSAKYFKDNFNESQYPDPLDAYEQGFIDATRLAAENGTCKIGTSGMYTLVDKQSILKAIEE